MSSSIRHQGTLRLKLFVRFLFSYIPIIPSPWLLRLGLDDLGPNPFRLHPRAQCEVASEDHASIPSSSLGSYQGMSSSAPSSLPQQGRPGDVREAHSPDPWSLLSRSHSDPARRLPIPNQQVADVSVMTLAPVPPLPPLAVLPSRPTPQSLFPSDRSRNEAGGLGPRCFRLSARWRHIASQRPTAPTHQASLPSVPFSSASRALSPSNRSRREQGEIGFNPLKLPSRSQRAQYEAEKRLQAWLASALGKIPAEVREIIYEHVLTVSTPQSPITIRGPSDNKKENAVNESLDDRENSCGGRDHSSPPNLSTLAILQTCRLIHQEARDIYYASNAFRTTSPQDLLHFLQRLDLHRRDKLKTLDIEGLLTPEPIFSQKFLDQRHTQGAIDVATYQRLAAMRKLSLGAAADAASELLRLCKGLRRIHFVLEEGEELSYISFLRKIGGYCKSQVDFVDESHWVLRSPVEAEEWHTVFLMAYRDGESRNALFPLLLEGEQRRIEVEIVRGQKPKVPSISEFDFSSEVDSE